MKKFVYLLPFLLLTACVDDEKAIETESEPAEFVIEEREYADPPATSGYVPDFTTTDIEELPVEVLEELSVERPMSETVTTDEMREDIDTFLRAMRYGYGPYEFYGGDEAFLAAENELNKWIDSQDRPVSTLTFTGKLSDAYSFIKDQHFGIAGTQAYMKEVIPHSVEDWIFTKEGDTYFYEGEEVISVNGEDAEAYMKPSLGESGEEIYRTVSMSEDGAGQWTLETADDTYTAFSFQMTVKQDETDSLFDISETDEEIPVIRFGTFMFTEEQDFTFEDMFEAIDVIEDAPAAILDLRDNGGGLTGFGTRFVHELTGAPPSHSESVWLDTKTINLLMMERFKGRIEEGVIYKTFYEDYGLFLPDPNEEFQLPDESAAGIETFDTLWAGTDVEISESPSLETPLYILMNENSGSAAELLISDLLEYDQTTLMGTATRGMFTSDAGSLFYLPNSGISIHMPGSVIVSPYSFEREAIGIEPDIWLSGSDAMERMVEWVEEQHVE
ncbi:hypothetical protein KP77_10520 [Jeotgalibacillus alimentarius]|uniref:Tail specific protease domain-containing protein n=1 Tax=Jeotgalibacillus alimentarius TaxID=135826 RepID=A0A0C2RMS9_9BACL|nr:S41 family peptidase [Jeotgalibacillus alimentarius]KIL51540.1 hypothetical protein KP77_10520 [Jeotgalibacillus alimentarius]